MERWGGREVDHSTCCCGCDTCFCPQVSNANAMKFQVASSRMSILRSSSETSTFKAFRKSLTTDAKSRQVCGVSLGHRSRRVRRLWDAGCGGAVASSTPVASVSTVDGRVCAGTRIVQLEATALLPPRPPQSSRLTFSFPCTRPTPEWRLAT